MARVVLDSVTKSYPGGVKAVQCVSLAIGDGEFVVLVGPSGCGKSTLLRMIAGLEEISDGTIRIGERIVNDLPPKARDIAMVFQNYALYPHMTAYENMAFALKLRRVSRSEISSAIEKTAAMLGLTDLLPRLPRQLSGGQRQRVALGRAIVRQPAVFLFDEPLSNLDAKMRVQLRVEIKRIHQTLKRTMVYVTHDQIEAMTMGDRIVVMNEGVVQQVGTPDEIYNFPANVFVASFIGTPAMNLIEGTIERADGRLFFRSTELRYEIPGVYQSHLDPIANRRIVIGIRPENFLPANGETPDFAAAIDVIEPTGADTYVFLANGANQIVARLDPNVKLSAGEQVHLRINSSRLHFFDAETRNRVSIDEKVQLGTDQ